MNCRHRNLELTDSNNDLVNLLGSVQMAIVMLGRTCASAALRRSPSTLFNLLPADIGRPIGEIKLNLHIADFEALLHEVIDTVTRQGARRCRTGEGRWLLCCGMRPYRTLENQIDGAVVDARSISTAVQAAARMR